MRALGALIFLGVTLCAQEAPASSRITGIVVSAITGERISSASVAARPASDDVVDTFGFHRRAADLLHTSHTLTDEFGRFSLDADPSLEALQLSVSHPGFRSEDDRDSASVTVRIAEARGIRVRLTPVSIIQGSVVSTDGQPLTGIIVQAIRMEIRNGRQVRTAFVDKNTDNRGEYRFDGLPAGAYYLRATSPPIAGAAFGPVYYPSASSPDSAQTVRVGPGRTVIADFTLESRPHYRIRGIVSNPPPRRPLAMRLLREDDPLGNTATFSPNGTFEMANVAPGSYLLQAYTPNSTPPDFGEATITVGERDLVGVKIALTNGVDVAGHVEFRGPIGSEHYAQIHAVAVNERRWPVNVVEPSVIVNERGNFLLRNLLPGQYDISVHGLPDFYVSEIRSEGSDVLVDGLTVKPDDAPRLSIVMQAGGGQIEGIVEENDSRSFEVALVARDGLTQVPTLVHAPQGRFHAAGLTPGEYTLYAWPETLAVEYRDPIALAELSAYSVSVNVQDGGTQVVALKPIP